MSFDPTSAFALFDDARPRGSGGARLFMRPRELVVATSLAEVQLTLDRLRRALKDGLWAAGFIGFEAGYMLEPRLAPLARPPADGLPLIWFGLFERGQRLDPDEVADLLGDRRGAVGPIAPRIDEASHRSAVERVRALIAAGDIYQTNLTFATDVRTNGHPLGLYARLRGAQAAPHGAVIHTGESWALSFSPELFFTLDHGRLTAKPMKGTAARAPTLAADGAAAAALSADPKNRAENLMIVDLLRNDLARVAVPGSVAVERLFEVETYPTIHQMTSTVAARLQDDCDSVDVLEALFPCGSVTGAPKIRAMEVITEVEPAPRGLYTGSIGWLAPDGDASFNVAIRTLVVDRTGRTTLGLGSGIVADSEPDSEWRECLAKAAFLQRTGRRFDLIETMRFSPNEGIHLFDRHLVRLTESAAYWGFECSRHVVRNSLQAAVGALTEPCRVRLLLSRDGNVCVQTQPLPPAPTEPVEVKLAPLPLASTDPRLFHKTTDRAFHDEARARAGSFEILFVNEGGQLTEGSFTNLFVPRDGRLVTPPLAAGLLPGVLRAELLDSGQAVEAPLAPADLAGEFLIGNSARGLISARLHGDVKITEFTSKPKSSG